MVGGLQRLISLSLALICSLAPIVLTCSFGPTLLVWTCAYCTHTLTPYLKGEAFHSLCRGVNSRTKMDGLIFSTFNQSYIALGMPSAITHSNTHAVHPSLLRICIKFWTKSDKHVFVCTFVCEHDASKRYRSSRRKFGIDLAGDCRSM